MWFWLIPLLSFQAAKGRCFPKLYGEDDFKTLIQKKDIIKHTMASKSPASQKIEEAEANYSTRLNKLDFHNICQIQFL